METPAGVQRINVESAEQMLVTALEVAPSADIFIGAAAVADYRPVAVADQKIKKGQEELMELRLVKNPDIIASVSALPNRPFTVGFAAETENVLTYARSKLERKSLDLVIANDVSQSGIGFNADENEVTLVSTAGEFKRPRDSKHSLAQTLIEQIAELMGANEH